jgi:cytochrome c biogenesis protein CcmG, thiol:disulfide interchange protein DsbE
MTRRTWNLAFGIVLVVGMLWLWVGRVSPAEPATGGDGLPPAPAMGHPAPDFKLTTVTGETVTLAALRGKPVVLNFWATWCPPCRAELPELQAASQRYRGQLDIIGVNQAEPADGVTAFAQQFGLTFPIPLDVNAEVSRQFAVRSLPTTFFIDRSGVIRHIQSGPLTEATLAQALRAIYP